MKILRFNISFSMPIQDGETPEEIENKVIEVIDTLGNNMVLSYKTEIEELDDE